MIDAGKIDAGKIVWATNTAEQSKWFSQGGYIPIGTQWVRSEGTGYLRYERGEQSVNVMLHEDGTVHVSPEAFKELMELLGFEQV